MKTGKKLLAGLDAAYARRQGRDGTLDYLTRVYAVARQNRKSNPDFSAALRNRLQRKLDPNRLFAEIIEVTSGYASGDRSKYAKVLRIAHGRKIDSKHFKAFVKEAGGFNAVIAGGKASPSITLSFAGQKRQLDRKALEKAAVRGQGTIKVRYKLNDQRALKLVGKPQLRACAPM